jgi:hypothetical protein
MDRKCGWPGSACGGEKLAHFCDIHTTILHQLGLGQNLLTYLRHGCEKRLTQTYGQVITDLV